MEVWRYFYLGNGVSGTQEAEMSWRGRRVGRGLVQRGLAISAFMGLPVDTPGPRAPYQGSQSSVRPASQLSFSLCPIHLLFTTFLPLILHKHLASKVSSQHLLLSECWGGVVGVGSKMAEFLPGEAEKQ